MTTVMLILLLLGVLVTWPIWFVLSLIFWFAFLWAIGFKITIKQKDAKIGYVRWFRFYRYGV